MTPGRRDRNADRRSACAASRRVPARPTGVPLRTSLALGSYSPAPLLISLLVHQQNPAVFAVVLDEALTHLTRRSGRDRARADRAPIGAVTSTGADGRPPGRGCAPRGLVHRRDAVRWLRAPTVAAERVEPQRRNAGAVRAAVERLEVVRTEQKLAEDPLRVHARDLPRAAGSRLATSVSSSDTKLVSMRRQNSWPTAYGSSNGSSDGAVGPVTSIEGIGTADVVGTPVSDPPQPLSAGTANAIMSMTALRRMVMVPSVSLRHRGQPLAVAPSARLPFGGGLVREAGAGHAVVTTCGSSRRLPRGEWIDETSIGGWNMSTVTGRCPKGNADA